MVPRKGHNVARHKNISSKPRDNCQTFENDGHERKVAHHQWLPIITKMGGRCCCTGFIHQVIGKHKAAKWSVNVNATRARGKIAMLGHLMGGL
eukprot:scaffold195170_cov18-Prasinocladus_malaysianus.AAC.1